MFDYLIIGAGFAGSVIAERIVNVLDKKVIVIDRRSHIGGNCYDFKDDNNIIIHKYGPHLFHTSNKGVFDYLSQFTNWDIYNHKVLAFIDGQYVPIPFNLNTLHMVFPEILAKRIEDKLLQRFNYNIKVPILELLKEDDNDLKFLANYVYEKVFLNYTLKQWGLKPEEIDKEVSSRVPIFIGRDDRYFNDTYQAVPNKGYTKIFENMLCSKNIKIMLNTDFREVCSIKDDGVYLFDRKFTGKVIYTGQIDELFDYRFGELPYRSIEMGFERVNVKWYQKAGTVNYPNNYDFTRITEFKHIHYADTDNTTILREYPQSHVRGKNIPYYPVFTDENKRKYNEYLAYSKRYSNLILLGRLAEYRYYDMDDIIERALEVFEKEILNGRQ